MVTMSLRLLTSEVVNQLSQVNNRAVESRGASAPFLKGGMNRMNDYATEKEMEYHCSEYPCRACPISDRCPMLENLLNWAISDSEVSYDD